MLRVTLTAGDLDLVRIASRPAPMLELRTVFRAPLVGPRVPARAADVELVRSLVAQPCAPGFLFAAAPDADHAIDTVVGTPRDAVRRDLEDNATAGFPLPGWSADLVRPGVAGTRARHRLQGALTHVASTYLDPRIHRAAPLVSERTRAWRATASARGAPAMLDSLHPGIRCRDSVLEIDLASGAQIDVSTTGSGIRVVPTLSPLPGATLSSDGTAPLVLTVPVPVPAGWTSDLRPGSDRALEQLMGSSRSTLLEIIAASPGLGTRELARVSGFAPASVSDHTAVLRRAGLVDTTADGARTAHAVTALGWALLRHDGGLR